MRNISFFVLACMMVIHAGKAQDISVKGVVMEEKQDGSLVPIEFANVYWLKSTRNTTTDSTGYFFIAHAPEDGDKLVFQFLGFEPDTVDVVPGQYISVLFKEEATVLGEVVVALRKFLFSTRYRFRIYQRKNSLKLHVAIFPKALKPMQLWM